MTTQTQQSKWLTVKQVAEACKVTGRTIYNHLSQLPSYKLGPARLFKAGDLNKIKAVILKN